MTIKTWHLIGLLVSLVLGTLLHFVYQWSGENPAVGVIGSVNESTWEHMKLVFWPVTLFAIVEYIAYGHMLPNFIAVKALSILFATLLVPVLFYTYTGILGRDVFVLDILIFVIAVVAAYALSWMWLQSGRLSSLPAQILGLVVIVGMAIAFGVFTFAPPPLPLFTPPETA